jgi:hypothetical protein
MSTMSSASSAWWPSSERRLRSRWLRPRDAVGAGKGTDARNLMVAHGIAVQRGADLAAELRAVREHEVKLAKGQGELIARVLVKVFDDLGVWKVLGQGQPGAAVVKHHLRAASSGDPVAPAPEADAARARDALRRLVMADLAAEGLVVTRPELVRGEDDEGPRQLPPGDDDDGDPKGGEVLGQVAPAIRKVRTFRERLRDAAGAVRTAILGRSGARCCLRARRAWRRPLRRPRTARPRSTGTMTFGAGRRDGGRADQTAAGGGARAVRRDGRSCRVG